MQISSKTITKKRAISDFSWAFSGIYRWTDLGIELGNLKDQKQLVSSPICLSRFFCDHFIWGSTSFFGAYQLLIVFTLVILSFLVFFLTFYRSFSKLPIRQKKLQICLNSFHIFHLFVLVAVFHIAPCYDWTF